MADNFLLFYGKTQMKGTWSFLVILGNLEKERKRGLIFILLV